MSKLRVMVAVPFLAALAFSGAAQAHPHLMSSTPAADATVEKPGKVILTFNERVVANFTGADLVMTSMPGMTMTEPMKMNGFSSAMSADGKTLTLLMKRALPTGAYQLKWHAVGDDTHRMKGQFSFNVK